MNQILTDYLKSQFFLIWTEHNQSTGSSVHPLAVLSG